MFEEAGMQPRAILHVDMDAFFASVAQLDDPSLAGLPVIVGGHSVKRGVVSSCSYEARAMGVRNAMPLYQALKHCPKARVVPGNMQRYREINLQLRTIWERYSPTVQVASFDEAYLDLTGCEALLGPPGEVAARLQAEIEQVTGLPCSVGVASSKLLAKVASERYKPRGLCVVPAGEEAAWLADLRIGELHGVGPRTAELLARYGLRKVADLHTVPLETLERLVGPYARQLRQMAEGIDSRPVTPSSPAKSIGAEQTFGEDLTDPAELEAVFVDLVQEVAYRLRRARLFTRTITIKVRYGDFETITRARTLEAATDDDDKIRETARALFRQHVAQGRRVRLLGVSVSHFVLASQLSWLAEPRYEERRVLNQTLDRLRERYGLWVVSRGTHIEPQGA
jgi:DNA polymerase-4